MHLPDGAAASEIGHGHVTRMLETMPKIHCYEHVVEFKRALLMLRMELPSPTDEVL